VYTGRTRHIHVKVQAPNSRVLTTQLYFPGEAQNARDRIYSPKLRMAMSSDGGMQRGAFTFVVRT
jgi:protocatechuate 3,4-dioxygenase beta subunit